MVTRLDQTTHQVEELLPDLTRVPASGLGQSAGLAQEMRQAANAVEVRTVDRVILAHQAASKTAMQGIDEDLGATCADEIHHRRHGVEHPQPQQLAAFSPRRLVQVQQAGALDLLQQQVFKRRDLAGALPYGLVDESGGQLQPEQLPEEFPDLGAREPIAQAEHDDQPGQARPEHLLGIHPRALPFGQNQRTWRLMAAAVAAPAPGFPESVLRHPQPQTRGIRIGLQHFDFVVTAAGSAHRLGCEGFVTGRASLRPMIERTFRTEFGRSQDIFEQRFR